MNAKPATNGNGNGWRQWAITTLIALVTFMGGGYVENLHSDRVMAEIADKLDEHKEDGHPWMVERVAAMQRQLDGHVRGVREIKKVLDRIEGKLGSN
ncbi:MAG: hypothetical protein CMN84_05900 [Spongiibacteraceae bacterium]|nr:hypothetical protein [Spongiibacteraceae bacterium]